jgi:PadR family transcriptional regulator, regulatory protein PadR
MLEAPGADWYGLELAGRANLKSGTIYPILARLERSGWLTSAWEEVDPAKEKRPRRRLYRLTGAGEKAAQAAAAEMFEHLAPSAGAKREWGLKPRGEPT